MRSRGTGPSSFVNKGPSNRVATLTTRGRSQRRGARGSFSCRRVRHAHLAARRRATMGVPKQRRERSTTSRGTGYSLDSSPDYRAVLRRPHDETIAFEGLIAPCYAARREVCRHPRSPGPVEQSRWHSAVRCERHRGQEAMLRPTRLGLAMRLDYVRQFCTQYLYPFTRFTRLKAGATQVDCRREGWRKRGADTGRRSGSASAGCA